MEKLRTVDRAMDLQNRNERVLLQGTEDQSADLIQISTWSNSKYSAPTPTLRTCYMTTLYINCKIITSVTPSSHASCLHLADVQTTRKRERGGGAFFFLHHSLGLGSSRLMASMQCINTDAIPYLSLSSKLPPLPSSPGPWVQH